MYEIFFLIALLLQSSECSRVIEKGSQTGIHLSDYCPASPHCPEGSHVMCMYYDPEHPVSPRCYDPQNATMTTVLSERLLKLFNAVRGRIAMGKETGENNKPLPRGYSMMKLEWDSELATFAQVLANQCAMMNDLCRATSRFPDPGQIAGQCRFRYPNWTPISNIQYSSNFVTEEKLLHALSAVVRGWYSRKLYVNRENLLKYPDWTKTLRLPRAYLNMVYSSLTHIGCGVSASTHYAYNPKTAPITNMASVICNLSIQPTVDLPVYPMEHPNKVGYTVKCGCPPGYDEDQTCLCSPNPKYDQNEEDANCHPNKCQPKMILLPIFTVEDAPPEKLIPPYKTFRGRVNDFDFFDNAGNTSVMQSLTGYQQRISSPRIANNNINEGQRKIKYKKFAPKPIMQDVPKRSFNKKPILPKVPYHSKAGHALGYSSIKKTSIFAKVPIFDLSKKQDKSYKVDVQPRRDFSNAKHLVNDYMSHRRNQFQNKGHLMITKNLNHHPTETFLSSAEEKVMNYNFYLQNKINSNISEPTPLSDGFSDFDSSHEKSNDNNLMHLLNKLEQEVKHIELDGVKREIFDAKIRKIYGAVVGDTTDLLSRRYEGAFDTDFNTEMTDIENDQGRYSDFENGNHHLQNINHNTIDLPNNEHNLDTNYYDRNFDANHQNRRITNSRNSLIHNDLDREHLRSVKRSKYDPDVYNYELNLNKGSPKDMYKETLRVEPRNTYHEKAEKLTDGYSDVDIRRRPSFIEKRPLEHESYNNLEGPEKRKFYQNKLDKLEMKIRESHAKHRSHKDNKDRPSVPMRPQPRVETPIRPVKSQLDPFYMADGARYLHGF